MTIEDVLFFDCETTGLPPKGADWYTDYNDFPHIVQIAWRIGGKTESHIIRPDGWIIPEETIEIHGITNEIAEKKGEPLAAVLDVFLQRCHEAGLLCGHGIYFDTSVIKANVLRELGMTYYEAQAVELALWKGKRIDTMRSSMKWVDARTSAGRLKFPTLSELYSRCFPGESFPAHDASYDVEAVARCLPVLVSGGLVELAVKEYPEESATEEKPVNAPKIDSNSENDKLPIQKEKTSLTGNLGEISGIHQELLQQNDF